MNEIPIIPILFKTEYSKMVSVLTRTFGLEYIEIAEDIVSETFLSALDIWPYKGTPENPTAWLYTVAKNKLKNQLKRKNTIDRIVSERSSNRTQFNEFNVVFSEKNISDTQIHMF